MTIFDHVLVDARVIEAETQIIEVFFHQNVFLFKNQIDGFYIFINIEQLEHFLLLFQVKILCSFNKFGFKVVFV